MWVWSQARQSQGDAALQFQALHALVAAIQWLLLLPIKVSLSQAFALGCLYQLFTCAATPNCTSCSATQDSVPLH